MKTDDWILAKAAWPKPGSPPCTICHKLVEGRFYHSGNDIAHQECIDNLPDAVENSQEAVSLALDRLIGIELERNRMLYAFKCIECGKDVVDKALEASKK
jgi:hypothetical protein